MRNLIILLASVLALALTAACAAADGLGNAVRGSVDTPAATPNIPATVTAAVNSALATAAPATPAVMPTPTVAPVDLPHPNAPVVDQSALPNPNVSPCHWDNRSYTFTLTTAQVSALCNVPPPYGSDEYLDPMLILNDFVRYESWATKTWVGEVVQLALPQINAMLHQEGSIYILESHIPKGKIDAFQSRPQDAPWLRYNDSEIPKGASIVVLSVSRGKSIA